MTVYDPYVNMLRGTTEAMSRGDRRRITRSR